MRRLNNCMANFLMLSPRLDTDDFQRKSLLESLSYIPLNDIKIINISVQRSTTLTHIRVM